MKFLGLQPLWLHWKLVYYEWASRELHPLHRDYPKIVLKLAELRRQIDERGTT